MGRLRTVGSKCSTGKSNGGQITLHCLGQFGRELVAALFVSEVVFYRTTEAQRTRRKEVEKEFLVIFFGHIELIIIR